MSGRITVSLAEFGPPIRCPAQTWRGRWMQPVPPRMISPIRCPNPARQPRSQPYIAGVSNVLAISAPKADIYRRALDARDPRFDGVFFVGITTTHVYCRPVCPARLALNSHRLFFESAASAEQAGFRPCLRCRPELAPGRALMDAVPRLARVAALRISAGALNGRPVSQLAAELGVSERHLRRALEREIGVSPLELALTHRLLLAKQLLADTALSVTHVAFASGFQSLRRFNAVFRERYNLSPSEVRSARRHNTTPAPVSRGDAGRPDADLVALTLTYRPPIAWDLLLSQLRRDTLPGVDVVSGGRYARTVDLEGKRGLIVAENACSATEGRRAWGSHLTVRVSTSLLPVLMPLLARIRQLFDLDAEPRAVDAHLAQSGLEALVRRHPGLRLAGAFDAFDVVLRALLVGRGSRAIAARVVGELGTPVVSGIADLHRALPDVSCVADAGEGSLVALGVSADIARTLVAIARAIADGTLRLEPGDDVDATRQALLKIDGVDEQLATTIVMRTLHWPDAFPRHDRDLQRLAGAGSQQMLVAMAQRWRPWRAYAAAHLKLRALELRAAKRESRASA